MPERANRLWPLLIAGLAACSDNGFEPDEAISCEYCEAWNQPLAGFRVFGNTYYVGTAGLGSVLLDTGAGLILLDGGLPQSASLIEENIRDLGFDVAEIRFIALSHAHYDHAGGIAAFVRHSGATVLAGRDAIRVLKKGVPYDDDPQFGGDMPAFPPVEDAIAVDDETILSLGSVKLRAVPTPGHTPGGTSWTWQSCEDDRCLDIVYADSLSPVSAPGYRFSDGAGEQIRASARTIGALECDILLSTHDTSFGLHDKLAEGRDAFIGDGACKAYGDRTLERLERRLAAEQT